jgi:hypothetical protein
MSTVFSSISFKREYSKNENITPQTDKERICKLTLTHIKKDTTAKRKAYIVEPKNLSLYSSETEKLTDLLFKACRMVVEEAMVFRPHNGYVSCYTLLFNELTTITINSTGLTSDFACKSANTETTKLCDEVSKTVIVANYFNITETCSDTNATELANEILSLVNHECDNPSSEFKLEFESVKV